MQTRPGGWSKIRTAIGIVLSTALLGTGFAGLTGLPAAQADTAPTSPTTPETVSADPLPTWQVTGVVWGQAIAGNTVYATGNFTKARPPGMWQGGPTEISVGHLLAYDISTGNRVSSFDHVLNAQGLAVAATPDGKTVYVGGDFTTVDGVARQHIAAFDTATGALISSFAPIVNGQVKGLVATNDTVYVAGAFQSAGNVPRQNLAAFSSTGVLKSWAPSADAYAYALTLTPDRSKVVVGGQFLNLNGSPVYGMGAVDAITGASLPWAANSVIKDSDKGAIYALTTDGTSIYGTGYAFGAGGYFEGAFSLNPADGSIHWLEDCHGDTYGVAPVGNVAYTIGHAHDCTMITGGFPDTSPRTRWQHAMAWTNYPTGTNNGPDSYGWNYLGQPAPSILQWYPNLGIGTATGQYQAAWSIAAANGYVVLGGEFPTVNGKPQQGLTRFAMKTSAPNKVGPTYDDTVPVRTGTPATNAVAVSPGTVRITFGAAWDFDNTRLTYQVYRDRGTAAERLIKTYTFDSNFWTVPDQVVTDNSAPAGDHTYQVRITDPFGNELLSPVSNTVTVDGRTLSPYAAQVELDGADHYWRLGEPAGSTTALDSVGNADGDVPLGVTLGTTGAVSGDPDTAGTFNGTSTASIGAGTSAVAGPSTFTLQGWFQTTSTTGGKLAGFGTARTGSSTSFDRQVYLTNNGRVAFGVYPKAVRVITSPTSYNNGQWHMFSASLSRDGMALYVDGRLIGRDRTVTTAQAYNGYWRLGGDSLGSWPNAPTSNYVRANLDDIATYPTALTAAQVNDLYTKSGRASTVPASAPGDAYGAATFTGNPTLYWRLGETSGPVAADRSTSDNRGLYQGTPTFGQAGALTTSTDKAVGVGTRSSYVSSASNFVAPAAYSEELWFKTSSTKGGKLIGFGSSATGLSSKVDRNLTMTTAGKVRFATLRGATQVSVNSPLSYNNNKWHYAVASQGPSGMRLYVDGALVGSNSNTVSSTFTGFWRAGYDTVWSGGGTSFAGSIDEVAVYPRALSLTEIKNKFRAGGGKVANTPAVALIGTATKTLTVKALNAGPTAAFTSAADKLSVSFDGTRSADPDGTIAGYAWDFGDNKTGTGSKPSHSYAAPGTYAVKLTVTDNDGATGSVTTSIVVAGPLARDSFARTVASGWGTADLGGAWTLTDSAKNYAVGGGTGTIELAEAGSRPAAEIAIGSTDTDLAYTFAFDKAAAGGGQYARAIVRGDANDGYQATVGVKSDHSMVLSLTKVVGGSETVLDSEALATTFSPNTAYRVRVQAWGSGTTNLRAKVWRTDGTEPSSWSTSTTDTTTGLQAAGGIAVQGYLSGSATAAPVTLTISDLLARPTGN